MSDYKTAVNLKRAAEILGFPEWDWIEPANEHQRWALRVLTDAFQPSPSSNKVHLDTALHNATHWIDIAFDAGKRQGIEMERERWERKIRELFGLPKERKA